MAGGGGRDCRRSDMGAAQTRRRGRRQAARREIHHPNSSGHGTHTSRDPAAGTLQHHGSRPGRVLPDREADRDAESLVSEANRIEKSPKLGRNSGGDRCLPAGCEERHMSGVATSWMRYRGDGSTPAGQPAETRGERGRYLADPKLVTAVNTSIAVGQPLLITGEPGTG